MSPGARCCKVLVRSLFRGWRDAGYHVARFDGRDDAGSELSGGTSTACRRMARRQLRIQPGQSRAPRTGAEEPYVKLKRALRAETDEGAWSCLYRTGSRAIASYHDDVGAPQAWRSFLFTVSATANILKDVGGSDYGVPRCVRVNACDHPAPCSALHTVVHTRTATPRIIGQGAGRVTSVFQDTRECLSAAGQGGVYAGDQIYPR